MAMNERPAIGSIKDFDTLRAYLQSQPVWSGPIAFITADGVRSVLTIRERLWLDVNGRPACVIWSNGTVVPYSSLDPPSAGAWTLRQHPQALVFDVPPVAGDQIILAALSAVG